MPFHPASVPLDPVTLVGFLGRRSFPEPPEGLSLMMIKTVELKNFMSHRHTTIELSGGLNVLIGQNNSGKSAIIAALQILCRNQSGDFMVRHGADECSIRVVTVVSSRHRCVGFPSQLYQDL